LLYLLVVYPKYTPEVLSKTKVGDFILAMTNSSPIEDVQRKYCLHSVLGHAIVHAEKGGSAMKLIVTVVALLAALALALPSTTALSSSGKDDWVQTRSFEMGIYMCDTQLSVARFITLVHEENKSYEEAQQEMGASPSGLPHCSGQKFIYVFLPVLAPPEGEREQPMTWVGSSSSTQYQIARALIIAVWSSDVGGYLVLGKPYVAYLAVNINDNTPDGQEL
tara:strand:+ start:28606 stop:29268 length:663 start_codon:yes stop_codon:yes gene_type:complete